MIQRINRRPGFTRNGKITLGYGLRKREPLLAPWLSSRTVLASTAEDASIASTEATTTTTTPALTESVHLKLNSEAMMVKLDGQEKAQDEEEDKQKRKRRKSKLLSYTDPNSKKTYNGLNISRRRFEAWINYTLGQPANSELVREEEMENSPSARESLRQKWKSRELLCDRTELLTVYESDKNRNDSIGIPKLKRGGFSDLLHLYADRFYGILLDEKEETKESLMNWLSQKYGKKETNRMLAKSFHKQDRGEQYRILQHFLQWFRSQYPYYYDRCGSCGSSYKEEVRKDNDETDEGSFLGYVYPSDGELHGKAGRTELYQCHKCHSFTRFPRFNKAQAVLNNRQGRCGEYSMLLYRMLSSLGHEARWIVDWADHVWTEILLDNKHWIHLDPCEAAIDNPLLYQEWGKQQTYILGFYAPRHSTAATTNKNGSSFPPIEDLTKKYTSDALDAIHQRREESVEEFDFGLTSTSEQLRQKIANLTSTSVFVR